MVMVAGFVVGSVSTPPATRPAGGEPRLYFTLDVTCFAMRPFPSVPSASRLPPKGAVIRWVPLSQGACGVVAPHLFPLPSVLLEPRLWMLEGLGVATVSCVEEGKP